MSGKEEEKRRTMNEAMNERKTFLKPYKGGLGIAQDRVQTKVQPWYLSWITGVCRNWSSEL
jgi:hypothetical protein